MKMDLLTSLYVFMLAGFIGFEVIRNITPLLHTPLMSLTNALDAIAVVGAIILAGEHKSTLATILGTIAIVAATSNVVGGFLIYQPPLPKNQKRRAPNKNNDTLDRNRHIYRNYLPDRYGAVHPFAGLDEVASDGSAWSARR